MVLREQQQQQQQEQQQQQQMKIVTALSTKPNMMQICW